MSKNCIICNKKIGFFDKLYEDKYCYECYEKQEAKRKQLEELKTALQKEIETKEQNQKRIGRNKKLEYIKKYLTSSEDNLYKLFKIMQFPMHYSESFKQSDISMSQILFNYIQIMIDELPENFTYRELKQLTITRNVSKITEQLNYFYKDKFNSALYNREALKDNAIYIEKLGKPSNYNRLDDTESFIMEFSTIDGLETIVNSLDKEIIKTIEQLQEYYSKAVKKETDSEYIRSLKNDLTYEIRMIYYQLALNVLYLVVYSSEIEKFLENAEISQIIDNLEAEVHNDEYLVEKVYDLYQNLYQQDFDIEFCLEDIVNILRYNRQRKNAIQPMKQEENIENKIEEYVFDVDIQPLINIENENEIFNKIAEEIENNIINLRENISLEKLLSIEELVAVNSAMILRKINKEKAKLEKERILNGNLEKERQFNNNELDYSNITDGYEFEQFVANLYKTLGYTVLDITSKSGDQGADVIIEKDNIKLAIQVKYYSSAVGNKAVQEIVAAKNFYKTDKAMVVTNNTFTQQARALAKANDVILVDGSELNSLIEKCKNK